MSRLEKSLFLESSLRREKQAFAPATLMIMSTVIVSTVIVSTVIVSTVVVSCVRIAGRMGVDTVFVAGEIFDTDCEQDAEEQSER
jgi:hypothetical protein